jgi:5-formyltetrahydrofolate cyclo-ligase
VPQSAAIKDRKRALREYALARRRAARRIAGPGADVRAANHYMAAVPTPAGAVVSGYCAINDEIDVMPLLIRLAGAGLVCCLPVVAGKRAPLTFRVWRPGAALATGPYRISEPLESAQQVEPTHLLVPLVAYDRDGYRLGYGGGYYDRSLHALRQTRPVIAIGMAYTEQLVEDLPHHDHDERLDWIVTERGAMPIPR